MTNTCPKCSKTMCEQFDDKPGPRGITLCVPNGKYKCLWCGYDSAASPTTKKDHEGYIE